MGNPHRREAAWRDLCADFEFEEELNPNDTQGLHRKRRRSEKKRKDEWRNRRLCGQVRRAVQMGLADCGDPDLQNLIVLDVEPTDRNSCLCVVLVQPATNAPEDSSQSVALLPRLHAVTPRLRSEVARSIHRKKTPQLIYRLQNQDTHDETHD
ncbi:MAG: hypothetical protein AAGA25_03785 [Planctomycetota bacterium]